MFLTFSTFDHERIPSKEKCCCTYVHEIEMWFIISSNVSRMRVIIFCELFKHFKVSANVLLYFLELVGKSATA